MLVYSAYITKNGVKIYAKAYGKKAFRFWVDDDQDGNQDGNQDDHNYLKDSNESNQDIIA